MKAIVPVFSAKFRRCALHAQSARATLSHPILRARAATRSSTYLCSDC